MPNSSARAGFSVSTVRRSIMSVRDTNFFQEAESKFRILGGRYSNRTRGRKARREGGGYQDNPRTRSLFKACLNTTRTLTECPVLQNAFLLDAKRNKSGKGLFSERGPHRKKFRWGICAPCNPKTPHTPTNENRARGKNPPPYLRGQKENVNKRI